MIYQIRSLTLGIVIFVTLVAGGTYFLQGSLVLVRHYDTYSHWAVVLFALPLFAGLVNRFAKTRWPLISSSVGALICAAILYPQYTKWWAVPPTMTDTGIYVMIIFGIGFMATQPLRTTFMIAFRLGRYSVQRFATTNNGNKNSRKTAKIDKQSLKQPANTQPVYTGHGSKLAMLELMIGVCSLALSVFSVFFLGQN